MLSINPDRLWTSLMELARIGATPKGGVRRLTLTELDRQGRDLVAGWLRALECELRIDPIGNLFAVARARCEDPAAAPVCIGSHLDTQPSGGKFDGAYGVLAGLEVLRTLADAGAATRRPVAVAIWTNEEGSRFTPVMMGSGVYSGAFTAAHCLARTDADGVSVGQALAAIGYAGTDSAPRLAAYLEPHIEQGPILEAERLTIGVVAGALGQQWFDVEVLGQDAHAGPTPLELRRDALLAASEMVLAVRNIAQTHPDYARGTVGQLVVSPNSRNVIPGRVNFSVDLRNAAPATLSAMVAALHEQLQRIAAAHRVQCTITPVVEFEACEFDAGLRASIAASAAARGLPSRSMASGAGHDAVYVARTCPAAMIFVPCAGGISHNEIESATPSDLAAGANVLLDVVLERARQ
jgi:beta-ureidopropionase / N-carbamoyl-L-amino-acid hydrolase